MPNENKNKWPFEARNHPTPGMTWLIKNKGGVEIGRVEVPMPFPKGHEFWDRDAKDPYVTMTLGEIFNKAMGIKYGKTKSNARTRRQSKV